MSVPGIDIISAVQRLGGLIHRTPVVTSATLDALSGKKLFFKCENLQKTGSFKARGATNGVLTKLEANPGLPGVVTHSSGNAGQAVAWAAKTAGLKCSIVVPEGTPQVKCDAIKGYGADLIFCEPNPTARKDTCARIAAETGFAIVHPYDDYSVMAGQATIGMELHEQIKGLDAVLVCVSGGGLTAGIAMATKMVNPNCKIIAVEAKGKELGPCLEKKERLWSDPPQFVDTIAEGIKTQQCGQLTFPILCDLVETKVITITDAEMVSACRLVAERMKMVIEAAAGAVVAAAVYKKDEIDANWPGLEKVGVILCGGNTDLNVYQMQGI